jgi:CheY-like chemotaxis protein
MMIPDHLAVPAVVLVVEDEMLLRMRAVDMVEDAGYISVEAVDADEAVAILESRSDIALMFTDIQMPGSMDGLKLAHSVHRRWPPIRIILVSGQLKLANIDIPPRQPVFRQTAGSQGHDRPDAVHDRSRLTPGVIGRKRR